MARASAASHVFRAKRSNNWSRFVVKMFCKILIPSTREINMIGKGNTMRNINQKTYKVINCFIRLNKYIYCCNIYIYICVFIIKTIYDILIHVWQIYDLPRKKYRIDVTSFLVNLINRVLRTIFRFRDLKYYYLPICTYLRCFDLLQIDGMML